MTAEKYRCTHDREGPRVGRNVVLWRQRCKRVVTVEPGQPVRCWQHGGVRKGRS